MITKVKTWLSSWRGKKAIYMYPFLLSKSTLTVWKIEADIVQQVDGIFFFLIQKQFFWNSIMV